MDYQIEIKDIGMGCFEATSPQYKNFSVTGPSREGVEDKLRELIHDYERSLWVMQRYSGALKELSQK